MIVCTEHGLLYLAPIQTGEDSVASVLKTQFRGVEYCRKDVYHSTEWEEALRPYYKFITVRHPYLRMVELWKSAAAMVQELDWVEPEDLDRPEYQKALWWQEHIGDGDLTLSDFMLEPSIRRYLHQDLWSCFWHIEQMEMPINRIVHQERFEEEIHQVTGLWGVQFYPPDFGPPLEKPWYEYYSKVTIQLVRDYWPRDFLPLGYNPNFKEVMQGRIFV